MSLDLDWTIVIHHWPLFIKGLWVDIFLAVCGFLLACILGLIIARFRAGRIKALSAFAFAYTQVVRGLPFYVLLLWLYSGLAIKIGLMLSPIQAMIICLGIAGSGLTTEIFRAGFEAIDPGQIEAGKAVGLNKFWIFSEILFPQVIRITVPPLGNIFVMLFKGATYAAVVAAPEIVFVTQNISADYYRPFEAYIALAVILISVVLIFSFLMRLLEQKLQLP